VVVTIPSVQHYIDSTLKKGTHNMKMIQSHLIANQIDTPVYQHPSRDEMPIALVAKSSWLGVMEQKGEWIHVIGIECEGWVMKSDVETLPPMELHAVWTPGKPIEYVRLAKAS
jgi:hypothetical protein